MSQLITMRPFVQRTTTSIVDCRFLISIVMPCLNEAKTLGGCIDQAHAGCLSAIRSRDLPDTAYEIIVADNASTDESRRIAIEHNASVIGVSQRGYGAAILGGIGVARGKYVLMGDSDGSYDFSEIPRFLKTLQSGYELVLGNRFTGTIQPGAMPWHHRYIGNPLEASH